MINLLKYWFKYLNTKISANHKTILMYSQSAVKQNNSGESNKRKMKHFDIMIATAQQVDLVILKSSNESASYLWSRYKMKDNQTESKSKEIYATNEIVG